MLYFYSHNIILYSYGNWRVETRDMNLTILSIEKFSHKDSNLLYFYNTKMFAQLFILSKCVTDNAIIMLIKKNQYR